MLLALLCVVCLGGTALAQRRPRPPKPVPTRQFTDRAYTPWVQTDEWRLNGQPAAIALVSLANPLSLTLHWDWLGPEPPFLDATLEACHADWQPANAPNWEYFPTFPSMPVPPPTPSQGTRVPYFHYQLEVAAPGRWFLRSGNYLLTVHPQGQPDQPVLTRRVLVVNATDWQVQAQIDAAAASPLSAHEVRVELAVNPQLVTDPYRELSAQVVPYPRWSAATPLLPPVFFRAQSVTWEGAAVTLPALRHPRVADVSSVVQQGYGVQSLRVSAQRAEAWLLTDRPRTSRLTQAEPQLEEAREVVSRDSEHRPEDLAGDYVQVQFQPQANAGPPPRPVGAWNHWGLTPDSASRQATWGPPQLHPLKMGRHAYDYVTPTQSQGPATMPWDTPSTDAPISYLILIYRKAFTDRFAQLVWAGRIWPQIGLNR